MHRGRLVEFAVCCVTTTGLLLFLCIMRMSHGHQCVHMHALCLTHCKMSICTTDTPPFPPIDPYCIVQVIHLVRPYRCMSCLCFCCLQKIEVQSPPGTVIGYIQQDCSFVYPWFSVLNAEEETVLRIKGPCWTCKFCESEFEVRGTTLF